MNYIFDIGNVLLNFKPKQFLHKLLDNPSDAEIIHEIIFKSVEWIKLEQGIITAKEACDNFLVKEPQYQVLINKVMESLPEMLTPILKTIELLPKIKAHGHRLFYLSNYHKELSIYVQVKYPFFSLFDGGVFSCDVNMMKPELEIYQYLINKYKPDPYDCMFFDDIEENIETAKSIGIQGMLFIDEYTVMNCIT